MLLSIEWNSIILGGHAHGIVTSTTHKTLLESFFYLSKTGPCAVISSKISSKIIKEVFYCLLDKLSLAILLLMLPILQNYQNETSDNRGF